MTTTEDTPKSFDLGSLRCAAGTDVGMRREENQDSFGIIKGDFFQSFFVADGMGGVHGGAVASRLTTSTLEELMEESVTRSPDGMIHIVNTINTRIFDRGRNEPNLAGMGTTLVGLIFRPEHTLLVNVGDSRAYRVRGDTVEQLTEDHTLVNELLKAGTITLAQAHNHPVSHMLTRSLGPLENVQVDCRILSEPPEVGDVYVLCSDGLYNFVEASEILDVVRQNPLDDSNQILINLANQRGGADNITVLVIAVGENVGKGRSSAYRKARDSSASTLGSAISDGAALSATSASFQEDEAPDISSSETSAGSQPDSSQTAGDASLTPVVVEPPTAKKGGRSMSRLRAEQAAKREAERRVAEEHRRDEEKRAKRESRFSSLTRTIPVPLLVAMALIFGLIVGSIAKKTVVGFLEEFDFRGAQTTQRDERESNSDSYKMPENSPSFAEVDAGPDSISLGTVDVASTIARVQSDRERILKTKEMFEGSIAKIDQQLKAFVAGEVPQLQETLKNARTQADELQGKLSETELQIDAASRKLSQWYGRQKRLESTDPLKLAAEVGATASNVQTKKSAFEQATYEFIKKRDEFELYPANEKLREQVTQLKEQRSQLLRELQEEVRSTVENVLTVTDKHLEELRYQRDMLNLQLQSVKQDLEVAKSLADQDPDRRIRMKNLLEQKRQGLKGSLEELEALLAQAGGPHGSRN